MLHILEFLAFSILGCILMYFLERGKIQQKLDKRDKLRQLIMDNVKTQSKSFIDEGTSKAIAIDEQNKKVHLFSLIENKCLSYDFDDVIKSEIVIDNNTVITSVRGKQVLGGVVGSLIAGVPGMLIGALSTEKTQTEKIKNVELKLTLNNMENSIFRLSFLKPIVVKKGHSRDFYLIKNAITEVEKWQGYFNIILKQQNNAI